MPQPAWTLSSLSLSLPAWTLLLAGVGAAYSLALLVEGARRAASALTRAWRARRRGPRRPTAYPLRTLALTNPWGRPFDRTTTLGDLRGLDLSARPLSPQTLARLARRPPLSPEAERQLYAALRQLPCTRDLQRHH